MFSLIGFGRWSPYYYYIIVSTLVKFFKEDILGVSADYQVLTHLTIHHHPVVILLFGFISNFIIGAIAWYILDYRKLEAKNNDEIDNKKKTQEKKVDTSINNKEDNIINDSQEEEDKDKNEEEEGHLKQGLNSSMKYYLIHNNVSDLEIEIVNRNSFKFIILSSFLIALKECCTKILFSQNDIFDYYFLNLIIISLILKIFFKQKIYKHQIFVIVLVSIIAGSCLISCIVISSGETDDNNSFTYNFKDKYYIIFLFIIVYIIICISFCTGIIFQKNLIHLEFKSPYKLISYKGLIGLLLSTIALIISSSIKCREAHKMEESGSDGGPPPPPRPGPHPDPIPGPDGENKTFDGDDTQIFVCPVIYNNYTYFDNILSYFEHVKEENTTEEILILIAYFILHFISEISLIFVNKFLSPIHYLITESFYSLFHLIYQLITNPLRPDSREEYITENTPTRILKFVAVFIEFIGYMIFLEIIQLNFCGLNRDISLNIEKRAHLELNHMDNDSESDFDLDDSLDGGQVELNKKEQNSNN